jgi:hypothetical protein
VNRRNVDDGDPAARRQPDYAPLREGHEALTSRGAPRPPTTMLSFRGRALSHRDGTLERPVGLCVRWQRYADGQQQRPLRHAAVRIPRSNKCRFRYSEEAGGASTRSIAERDLVPGIDAPLNSIGR